MNQQQDFEVKNNVAELMRRNRPDLDPSLEGGGACPFWITVKDCNENLPEGYCEALWNWGTNNEVWCADHSLVRQREDGKFDVENDIREGFCLDSDLNVDCTEVNDIAATILSETDSKLVNAMQLALVEEYNKNPDKYMDHISYSDLTGAMWAIVVRAYPKVETGDFPFDADFFLSDTIATAISNYRLDCDHVRSVIKNSLYLWLSYNLR